MFCVGFQASCCVLSWGERVQNLATHTQYRKWEWEILQSAVRDAEPVRKRRLPGMDMALGHRTKPSSRADLRLRRKRGITTGSKRTKRKRKRKRGTVRVRWVMLCVWRAAMCALAPQDSLALPQTALADLSAICVDVSFRSRRSIVGI